MIQDTLHHYLIKYNGDIQVAFDRLNDNNRQKLYTIKKRIKKMIVLPNAYFLTFTFNDNYIESFTSDINLAYTKVMYFLKKHCIHYVVNIDYGSLNNRLHFHAVVVQRDSIYHKYRYGAINYQPIYSNNYTRISSYIKKLSFHAVKDKTARIRFSRKKLK